MVLIEFSYKCAICETRFRSPGLPDESYGEFMLRSKSGIMAYLDALSSEEFGFVRNALIHNTKSSKLNDYERATLLHEIFGHFCDPASDGSEFVIDQMPCCPNCNSIDMASWGAVEPLMISDIDIEQVTFDKWHILTESEKLKLIDEAIDNFYLREEGKQV